MKCWRRIFNTNNLQISSNLCLSNTSLLSITKRGDIFPCYNRNNLLCYQMKKIDIVIWNLSKSLSYNRILSPHLQTHLDYQRHIFTNYNIFICLLLSLLNECRTHNKESAIQKRRLFCQNRINKYFYIILISKGITLNRNDYQKLFLLIKDLDC